MANALIEEHSPEHIAWASAWWFFIYCDNLAIVEVSFTWGARSNSSSTFQTPTVTLTELLFFLFLFLIKCWVAYFSECVFKVVKNTVAALTLEHHRFLNEAFFLWNFYNGYHCVCLIYSSQILCDKLVVSFNVLDATFCMWYGVLSIDITNRNINVLLSSKQLTAN